ncbi:Trihelix transcription factor [Melia azedarach]|uniref:Trihelix transcription factor n=1 Tax=Melia azedarach TaxID=155640 RepID=A0ACC1Y8M8_MELAZ|nr:Trihelix transcription factor [Melia azedarach]
MFDGVPDQLHRFIAASSRTSIPLPLSFTSSSSSSSSSLSLHHHVSSANTNIFPSFDPFSSSSHQLQVVQPHHFLHSLQQQSAAAPKNEEKEEKINRSSSVVGMNNLEIERERSIAEPVDSAWSNDELLALLRIRSSLENWFPELTWEHVSRKLEELGYKRSAEKCKEKFEEESRSFNNMNYNKNYRIFFSEFDDEDDDEEQLCHGRQNPQKVEQNKKMEQPRGEEEEDKTTEQNLEGDPTNNRTVGNKPSGRPQDKENRLVEKALSKGNKRKRDKNFEKFKVFCEDIVKKMIAQQEEMHSKLLEDMVKRDEEKLAREEAWKKEEMDRINKELEVRAFEQAIASDRQATIIKFLTKFTSSSSSNAADQHQSVGGRSEESSVKHKVLNWSLNPPTSSPLILAQNPNPTCHQANKQNNLEALPNSASSQTQKNPIMSTSLSKNLAPQNPSSNPSSKVAISSGIAQAPKNPSSPNTQNKQLVPTSPPRQNASQKVTSSDKDDIGKRWPRDEVSALINLRCSFYNNADDKEGAARTPLWERISQGMLQVGYKRSAKRCKEKWENINKYFRKTKDTNKKRSLDSRTCPYFHQLSTLYNQGTLVAPSEGTENLLALPENHSTPSQNHYGSSQGGNPITDSTMHVAHQEL